MTLVCLFVAGSAACFGPGLELKIVPSVGRVVVVRGVFWLVSYLTRPRGEVGSVCGFALLAKLGGDGSCIIYSQKSGKQSGASDGATGYEDN